LAKSSFLNDVIPIKTGHSFNQFDRLDLPWGSSPFHMGTRQTGRGIEVEFARNEVSDGDEVTEVPMTSLLGDQDYFGWQIFMTCMFQGYRIDAHQ
jgi:hypothetical protein